MKLGFIGTGKITLSVVTGICTSKISFQKILVSGQTAIAGKGNDLLNNPDVGRLFLGG